MDGRSSQQLPSGFQKSSAGVFLPDACVTGGLAERRAAAERATTGR
nr:hypothetical protein OG461_00165 [Streptomyces sp. NBC_00995]WSW71225.1 hypothetical protein OG461_36370 [Streptomyces sp. NBC_00995]